MIDNKLKATQRYPTDEQPAWLDSKPTSKMKAEYEAAMARRAIENGLTAKALSKVSWGGK